MSPATEGIVLAHALVATFFVLAVPFHLRALLRSRGRTKSLWTWQGIIKSAISAALAAGNAVTVVRGASDRPSHTAYALSPPLVFWTASALSLTANLGLCVSVFVEQACAPCAGDGTMAYLLAAVALDTVQLTLPHQRSTLNSSECLHLAHWALELILLLWETFGTFNGKPPPDAEDCPEDRSNVLSRAFFWWISPYLSRGYRNVLVSSDLPQLPGTLQPGMVREHMLRVWDQRRKPETGKTLPLALFHCLSVPLLAAAVPRIIIIVCQYAQPLLIQYSIRYVTSESSNVALGYWLVVAAVVTYVGLATATGVYENRLNQLSIMVRSALVSLIHDKIITSPSLDFDDGEAVTLMSNDASSLNGVPRMFHETWAQLVEVAIGIYLLSRQVGWVWPLPLILILFCSRVSKYVAKNLGPRQKAWNGATQDRVSAVSSMLGSMQVIKMLGLQAQMANLVRTLRDSELAAAARVRWMNVYYNASANALGIFTPALTLALYTIIAAAKGEPLDAETAFTTMAILSMVTHPANMVMTIVPRIVASLAGFDRIQNYLLRPTLVDQRMPLPAAKGTAVEVYGLDNDILTDINLTLPKGSIAVINGPVGSGKTVLLRTLLGEIAPHAGTLHLSAKRTAICGQRPWIPNGTVRSVITSMNSLMDWDWYQEILRVCCLDEDLRNLPNGDETVVGSRGGNLSGGQRQRLALARALYARPTLLLLDDTFSALDGTTEQAVIENMFGQRGALSKIGATVIVVANSSRLFSLADQVVIMNNGRVQEQGPWSSISAKLETIDKFSASQQDQGTSPSALTKRTEARDQAKKDLSRATGDIKIYGYYFTLAGVFNILLLLACVITFSFFITIPQYWLKLWTDSAGRHEILYLLGFLFLSFMSWSSTSVQMWITILRVAPESGRNMHNRLLNTVTGAKLLFFSQTDTGSILNRFSQDMQLVDKQLPMALQTLFVQIFKLTMQIVVLFVAQKWLSTSVPILAIIVYVVQKIYLRTSRQLRFLELESQAAVFSSFLETVEGLETVRAFAQTRSYTLGLLSNLSTSLRPEYLLFALQRWLNIVLDLLSAALAVGIIAIAVALRDTVSGAQVGVALNIMLVANSTLLKLVRSWTNLEVSLGAVARMRELEGSIDSEDTGSEQNEVPDQWPSAGNIEFKDLTASYGASDKPVLRGLSLNIDAGEKILLSGRTGSGKSSILNTLLGSLNIDHGTVLLDGVDPRTLLKQTLRERCFITVTQEPFILGSRSLRFNLDPNEEHSVEEVFSALRDTGLEAHFRQLPATAYRDDASPDPSYVLEQPISAFSTLSSGQTQLFGLARAVLKAQQCFSLGRRPVVLLDEITSSLDAETERKVHQVIERQFAGRGLTVVMVAHRKSGSMAGWRMVEMQEGRIVERDLE